MTKTNLFPKCDLPSKPTFLEIDHIDRVFPTPKGEYVALKDVYLDIKEGEFICVVGHSGCGKSTLLNIVAGLDRATAGGIVLEGREIRHPGPDRMVVFQNHSLLPWLTVRQNIALGVNRVFKHLSAKERQQIVQEHIDMVSLGHAADKYPNQISGGMKQRVGIARALAIRPKLLLLDEPFGALDALTRGRLQEQLMHICDTHKISALMITHDVDEALLLADRVVMMTNGPAAHVGRILPVELPRPRQRMEVVNNPNYYRMRGEMVEFLNHQKKLKKLRESHQQAVSISRGNIEKVNLTLGFIPLTDCAPLIVAQEKGFFEKYGLEVTLSRESSWGSIADRVRSGELDAALMIAGLPLAISFGLAGQEQTPTSIITAMTVSRNGNAITLGNRLWHEGVRSAGDLKNYVDSHEGKEVLGIVHTASMQNFLLRHWLASANIQPGIDVDLVVIPPPQMVANLVTGNIVGYCVGEPWNSRAVHDQVGFVVATDLDIWPGHMEKVLGVREDWAMSHPNTHIALIRALLESCQFCHRSENRDEIIHILARKEYLNADPFFVRPGFCGPFRFNSTETKYLQDFNIFSIGNTPSVNEHLWILGEMVKHGVIDFYTPNLVKKIVRRDIFAEAAAPLEIPLEEEPASLTLADGTTFKPEEILF